MHKIHPNAPLKGVKLAYFGAPKLDESQVSQRIQAVSAENAAFVTQLDQRYAELEKTILDRMPNLLQAMVKKVLGGLELQPEQIETIVREVLTEGPPSGATVKLSPADLAKVQSFASSLKSIKFEADEQLSSGDCLMESQFGLVDATVSTKVEQVVDQLS